MKHLRRILALLVFLCSGSLFAQPFTYQGMLRAAGIPADGNYDFQFSLWSAASGGSQIGSTITRTNVSVRNGLFTQQLDFGAVWDGSDRFLQIAVRRAGSGSYTTLSPRVRVTMTPYAVRALIAPWAGISGMPAGFADGIDNDTLYSAGAGLALTGTTFSIASGGVVTDMLANLAVTAAKLADGAVSTAKIADGAVTNAKIANNAVTSGKIADGAVTSAKIANNAVTTAKIADGAVTDAKLSSTGVSPGTYGSGTELPQITVNAQGRITGVTTIPVSGGPPSGPAGGDLIGTYPNPTVAGIRGRPVSDSQPEDGQILKWDGIQWTPANEIWQRSGSGIFYTSGYVGIGTSNPNSPLVVDSNLSRAIVAFARSDYRGTAIYGSSSGGSGVSGVSYSPSGAGVEGSNDADSGTAYGGRFQSMSRDSGIGVYAQARGTSSGSAAVQAWHIANEGFGIGVDGRVNSPEGVGVRGVGPRNGTFGYAYEFSGATQGVLGQAESGNPNAYGVMCLGRFAASGSKSLKIDHPLYPETQFLNHFCTESSEPMNAYSGVVTLDAHGEAWVQMPSYFQAINRDPRYMLTPIGAPMPNLHVAVEIENNRFKIAGGVPGKKVSWRVEAIRNDRWMQEYGYQTEQPKPQELRGRYLHPELYGQPKELGIHYRPELERPVRD